MSKVDLVVILVIFISVYGVTDLADHIGTNIVEHDRLLPNGDNMDMTKMLTLFSSFSHQKE